MLDSFDVWDIETLKQLKWHILVPMFLIAVGLFHEIKKVQTSLAHLHQRLDELE